MSILEHPNKRRLWSDRSNPDCPKHVLNGYKWAAITIDSKWNWWEASSRLRGGKPSFFPVKWLEIEKPLKKTLFLAKNPPIPTVFSANCLESYDWIDLISAVTNIAEPDLTLGFTRDRKSATSFKCSKWPTLIPHTQSTHSYYQTGESSHGEEIRPKATN